LGFRGKPKNGISGAVFVRGDGMGECPFEHAFKGVGLKEDDKELKLIRGFLER